MASVSLLGVTRLFDGGVTAVRDLDLEARDGEFLLLAGTSGCADGQLPGRVAERPATLQECDRIEGAGPWQRFRHITLPMLRPTGPPRTAGAGGAGSATDGTAVGIGVSRIASARRSATHTGMAASIRMVSIVTRWSGRSCALVLTLPILRTTSMPLMT